MNVCLYCKRAVTLGNSGAIETMASDGVKVFFCCIDHLDLYQAATGGRVVIGSSDVPDSTKGV